MGMTTGQRAALKRAINRFEAAVEEHAFIGTIPVDSEEALAAREVGIQNLRGVPCGM